MPYLIGLWPAISIGWCLFIQSDVKKHPNMKKIFIAHAQRAQWWSWLMVAFAACVCAASLQHHQFPLFYIELGLCVGLTGALYRWHERMLRQLPDPQSEEAA